MNPSWMILFYMSMFLNENGVEESGLRDRSALESRRVSLGAHWVDSTESSLLRRLERGREIGR